MMIGGRLFAVPWLALLALWMCVACTGCKAEEGYVRVEAVKPSVVALAPYTDLGLTAAEQAGDLTEAQASNMRLELQVLLSTLEEASEQSDQGEEEVHGALRPVRSPAMQLAVMPPRWSAEGRCTEYHAAAHVKEAVQPYP